MFGRQWLSAREEHRKFGCFAVSRITINSNISSLGAQRRLELTTKELRSTFERLSSGLRITRAGDDAAGLSVSELLNVDSRVFGQAVRNLNDGVSALSIADSALNELSSIVIRIRELATQSANGVLGPKQRAALNEEAQALSQEFTRIAQSTDFNGLGLLNGEVEEFRFQGGYGAAGTIASGLGGKMGSGTFTETSTINGSEVTGVYATALGDTNGDGILDLVSVSEGIAEVFIGSGDGTFSQVQTLITMYEPGQDVKLVDVNADGMLDAVTSGVWVGGGAVNIYLGQGDGTFGEAIVHGHDEHTPYKVAVGDLNGDGKIDLVTSGSDVWASPVTTVFLGNGDGTFAESFTLSAGGAGSDCQLGDLNNDGNLDLVVGGRGVGGGEISTFLGTGDGSFSKIQTLSPFIPDVEGVAIGDINGDGVLDLVAAGYSASAPVYLGRGDGTFEMHSQIDIDADWWKDVILEDLDGDGKLDLVGLGIDGGTGKVSIRVGNGNGSFGESELFDAQGMSCHHGVLGDINGDGVLDLVSSGYGATEGDSTVFLANTKDGTPGILPFDLGTLAGARQAIPMLDRKLDSISAQRSVIGAFEAQLGVELANLSSARENYLAAKSRITDADIAEDGARLVRLQILQNAASSVLAQANLQPQIAIQLINGA